jgi:flagellar motor protein MotB
MKSHARPVILIALAAAVAFPACVSVSEYTQVAEQLQIEQRNSRDTEKRARQLELLSEKLQKQLRVCTLERDEAREKLRVARTSIPGVRTPLPVIPETEPAKRSGVLLGTIFFLAGRDTLSETDVQKLTQIAARSAKLEGGEIVVSGHSDPTPIGKTQYQSNMHLSAVRALAVYHAFIALPGVDARRVSVTAYGEHKPAPPNVRRLRRVEITYIPDGK